MSLQLDGREYASKEPMENTLDMLATINNYCRNNNVLNSKGELIQFIANPTSITYLILIALGYITTSLQKLMFSTASSFSIAEATPRQLAQLAEISRMPRLQGSPTTIRAWAQNTGTTDIIRITPAMSYSVVAMGTTVTFNPAFEVVLQPTAQNVPVLLVATVLGGYEIPAATGVNFNIPVNDFIMNLDSSLPGTGLETISHWRTRIQDKAAEGSELYSCIQGLRALTGISSANVFFNIKSTESVIINNVVVPPRQSIIYIQGYSPNIATTYYTYMTALSTNTTGAFSQSYTTLSGQEMPVYYLPPDQVDIYVRVYTKHVITQVLWDSVVDIVMGLAMVKFIGENVTQHDINNQFANAEIFYTIEGAEVATDEASYGIATSLSGNQIANFKRENVKVYLLE